MAVPTPTSFQIQNPIGANNLQDLVNVISSRILEIVIPIAVLMYVWAGVNLLIAAGRANYITRAKTIFLYTTIGLLVIFIGGGFVSLIRSILNAGQ
jgi:hypothetical protein